MAKSYTLRYSADGKRGSKVGANLLSLMSEGGPGEILVRSGFTQRNWETFLSQVAVLAIKAGADGDKLADIYHKIAAGNCSQARQSVGSSSLKWEDSPKEISLAAYYGREDSARPALDGSIMSALGLSMADLQDEDPEEDAEDSEDS